MLDGDRIVLVLTYNDGMWMEWIVFVHRGMGM